MATKEDIAGLKENIAKIWKDMARLESVMATKQDIARLESTMATKQDIARIEKRLAVLSFAGYTIGPALLAFMVKLTFFP